MGETAEKMPGDRSGVSAICFKKKGIQEGALKNQEGRRRRHEDQE